MPLQQNIIADVIVPVVASVFGSDSILTKAIRGWTALENCGAAAANISTVKLNRDSEFTDPDIGWSFTKTSVGRELIGDIQFDSPLNAGGVYTETAWTNNADNVDTFTLGGILFIGLGVAVSTQPKVILEIGKTYRVVAEIESSGFVNGTIPQDIRFYFGGGTGTEVVGQFAGSGLLEFDVLITALAVNNRIAIIDASASGTLSVGSISVIEQVGEVETASVVTSTTTSPNDVIVFDCTWVADPTYGDVVVATYDSATGDYTDSSVLEASGIELNPDAGFDSPMDSVGGWQDPIAAGIVIAGSQLTMGPTNVTYIELDEAIAHGEEFEVTINIVSLTPTSGLGVIILLGGVNVGEVHSVGETKLNIVADNPGLDRLALTTTNLSYQFGEESIIEFAGIQRRVAGQMQDTEITLTNCLDIS